MRSKLRAMAFFSETHMNVGTHRPALGRNIDRSYAEQPVAEAIGCLGVQL